MNSHRDRAERRQNAIAIGIWENEGGAPGRYSMDIQHDCRIEPARSSTVYRVAASAPLRADGHAMTGKSRLEARKDMTSFNLLNIGYRKEWIRLSDAALNARGTTSVQPWR